MLFEFVWQADFERSLKEIEPCPYCADRLMRRIEHCCSKQVACGSHGYGLVRFRWRFQRLLTWYFAFNLTISIIAMERDFRMNHNAHRNVA
jgi:hypothetical protein